MNNKLIEFQENCILNKALYIRMHEYLTFTLDACETITGHFYLGQN